MIFQSEPSEHALDRALDIQLSCAFQKPLITACSNHSGLIAVYGIDSDGRANILIVSLASPSSQVWVRVPRALASAPIDSIEWSPIGVEEMLLFKCTDRVGVLSMSSSDRCAVVVLAVGTPMHWQRTGACPNQYSCVSYPPKQSVWP